MDGPTPSEAKKLGCPLSAREAAKLERALQARAAEEAKELARQMKAALRTPAEERSAAAVSLLSTHAEEASRLQAAMEKHAARKAADAANVAEIEDDAEVLREKLATLADAVRASKHVVVYTGAGISTAANIPDYRGPQGIWTQMKAKAPKGPLGSVSSGSRAGSVDKLSVEPTRAHMALATLVRAGRVKRVISQNVDGLHLRSGVPSSSLCELHGNVFRERCRECGREYLRGFDVTDGSAYHRHATERRCDKPGCRAALHDTIVYFGEKLHERELSAAQEASRQADLALFVGSSLKVLQHYKYMWEQGSGGTPARKFFAIVNLQPTPKDKMADLVLRARCDDVLQQLVSALGLQVQKYDPAQDAVLRLSHAPAKRPAGGSHLGKAATPAQAALEQPAPTRQGSKQAKHEDAQPARGQLSGGRASNGSPSRKPRQEANGSQKLKGGSGAEEVEKSSGCGRPQGKPSKVVLCCRCGVMLDNEKGKTIRDGCGTCDGDGCDHWACIPCSGVDAGYDGEWLCGCDACGGDVDGKASGAKGRASTDVPARVVGIKSETRAPPVPTGAVQPEMGSSGKKLKPSKVVLCCRCGVMLDNEKGKTIRDGCGTCDGEECDHWACIPCSGVDPGYDGEWFCGCESCPGKPCAAPPKREGNRRVLDGKGAEGAPMANGSSPTAPGGKAMPHAKKAALKREGDDGARGSSSTERPVATAEVKAAPSAAAEVRPPAQARTNGGAGASRMPSKVVLCCRCGVMLDNEKGKTIRDGCGTCDGDGCDHWACIPCSGVDAGYDGEWLCGCDACPDAALPAGGKTAHAERRPVRTVEPSDRRSRLSKDAGPEVGLASAPPDKAVRKPEAPADSSAPRDKDPADTNARSEEPAAVQQGLEDRLSPVKLACKEESVAATGAKEVHSAKRARNQRFTDSRARCEAASAKRGRSEEGRVTFVPDKTVRCCKCGLMLDNAKGTTLRDGCGPCDFKQCNHWACIPCSNVDPGYDGEWFCPCDGCAPVPSASAGGAQQSTAPQKRVGAVEPRETSSHRKRVRSADDSPAGGEADAPRSESLRRGRSADTEASVPEVKPHPAASSFPAAASKQPAGKPPARAPKQPEAAPASRTQVLKPPISERKAAARAPLAPAPDPAAAVLPEPAASVSRKPPPPVPTAPAAVPVPKAAATVTAPAAMRMPKAPAAVPKQLQQLAPSPAPPAVAASASQAVLVIESFLPPKKRQDGRLTPPVECMVGPALSSAAAVFECAASEQLKSAVSSPLLRSADLLLSLQHSVPMRPALPASAASEDPSASTALLPQPGVETHVPGR